MRKKLLCLLAALVLLLQGGCAGLLNTSGYESTPYTPTETDSPGLEDGRVESYRQLTAVLDAAIREHKEELVLQFRGYRGDAAADMATACERLRKEDALGVYALRQVDYTLRRIISYQEAVVTLEYKRSALRLQSIVEVSGVREMRQAIAQSLRRGTSYLTMHTEATTLTAEQVGDMVASCWLQLAPAALCLPKVKVTAYPDSGVERIFVLRLRYEEGMAERLARQEELEQAIARRLEQAVQAGNTPETLGVQLAGQLQYPGAEDPWAGTAYGALVRGCADNRGFALAFAALCRAGGIPAQVVGGTYQGAPRYWVLLSVGEDRWAHCDLYAGMRLYLVSDSEMSQSYSWDTSLYPVAEGLAEGAAAPQLSAGA